MIESQVPLAVDVYCNILAKICHRSLSSIVCYIVQYS